MDKKKIGWVSWSMLVKPKNKGGLRVGCLNSLNLSLLAKWWWRMKSDKNELWFRFIKAMHKLHLVDGKPLVKKTIPGV